MRTSFTTAEDNFIKNNYLTIPIKTIAKKIGRSGYGVSYRLKYLNLIIPIEIRKQRKKDSQMKPGHTPFNKGLKQTEFMTPEQIEKTKATRFKKGQLPHNTIGVKNGDVRIRTNYKDLNGKSYKWIRIARGNWVPLHRFIWEGVYGPLSERAVLRFIDGNQMNCSIDNLKLIDRKLNMELNTIHRYPDELKKSMRLLSKLNNKLKQTADGQ